MLKFVTKLCHRNAVNSLSSDTREAVQDQAATHCNKHFVLKSHDDCSQQFALPPVTALFTTEHWQVSLSVQMLVKMWVLVVGGWVVAGLNDRC